MPKIGVTDDFSFREVVEKRKMQIQQNNDNEVKTTMLDDHHTIEIEIFLFSFFRRNILNKYKKLISRSMLRERNEMV